MESGKKKKKKRLEQISYRALWFHSMFNTKCLVSLLNKVFLHVALFLSGVLKNLCPYSLIFHISFCGVECTTAVTLLSLLMSSLLKGKCWQPQDTVTSSTFFCFVQKYKKYHFCHNLYTISGMELHSLLPQCPTQYKMAQLSCLQTSQMCSDL